MRNVVRPDLNLLVVLEAIHSEGGVTRAAEKLNLTQPAISHALSRLRAMFADPLFLRQGHALVPTPLTRGLIEPLQRSLRELHALLSETGQFDAREAQTSFTLAMRDPVEILVLPPLLRRLAREAPGINLHALQVARRNIEARLAAGTLDLAIDVLLPLSENVRRTRVAADPLVVVARKRHPQLRTGYDLATYLKQQHVMVTSRRKGPGLEDLVLSQRGLQRRIQLRCRNYLAAFRVVSETDLILTMPKRYATRLNAGLGNRVLPLPIRAPTLDLYIYWHAAVDKDPANRWLRALVSESFAR
jgi:DNA-binding transcriptional LysR family regulator